MHRITVSPQGLAKIDQIFDTESGKRVSLIFESDDPITVSDEHHSMEELYEHRIHLFVALIKVLDSYVTPFNYPYARCWKSKLHDDGSNYEGWFIAGITVTKEYFQGPPVTQFITYHLPIKYWEVVNVMELEKAPPYDGYTPDEVLKRLLEL